MQANLSTMSDLAGANVVREDHHQALRRPVRITGRTMALRADQAAANQASRNADDGIAWLGTTDNAMQSPRSPRCAAHAT